MSCAFCGSSGPLTKEHVWSNWLADVSPDTRPGPHVMADDDEVLRIWEDDLFKLTVRCVCRRCNNTWMSQLEEAAKPVLTPLIREHRCTLSPEAQLVVATWAVKTVLVSQGREIGDRVPREHFEALYKHRRPPDDVSVIAADYSGRRYPAFISHQVKTLTVESSDGRRQPLQTYQGTVSVGHLVLMVFGHGLRGAYDFAPADWRAPYSALLWRCSQPQEIRWPLQQRIGDDALRRFGRYADGERPAA